jgi:hypothetical protein
VIEKSAKKTLADPQAKLHFLEDCLQEYCVMMTTDSNCEISYHKFFEDFLRDDSELRPTMVKLPEDTPRLVNVIEEIARMLVCTKMTEGVVIFSCTEECDFVNSGLCFLQSEQYPTI